MQVNTGVKIATISSIQFSWGSILKISDKQPVVEFTVGFNELMVANFGTEALGGRDAKQLEWTMEREAASKSSYAMKRNNVFAVSTDKAYGCLRDAIIHTKNQPIPSESQRDELRTRF